MRTTFDRRLLAPPEGGSAISIGVFDGVHLGHRAILAANVARAITDGAPAPDVVLASGPETSTAWLAVTGPATALSRPILLTRKDLLPGATATVLRDLAVERVVVAGGPRIVPDEVVAQLPDPTRLAASNRYTVSVVVAEWARDSGVDVSRVFVGSGAENAYPNTISAGSGRSRCCTPSSRAGWATSSSAGAAGRAASSRWSRSRRSAPT